MPEQSHAAAFPVDGSLEATSRRVLHQVRSSFAGVLGAIPDGPTRPHELQKSLGLHKTLAWKVAKIVECRDIASIYRYLPGPGAIEKVIDAARQRGVEDGLLDAVRDSMGELRALIAEQSGDRETFDMMLAGLTSQDRRDVDLPYRKDGFRSTSYIWGVQARTMFRSGILWPGARETELDAAILGGCVDLCRLRADRPWVIYRERPTDDHGEPITVPREPIDPNPPDRPPFLEGFHPPDGVGVHRVVLANDATEDEIRDGAIGTAGAVTCVTGEVLRGVVPRFRDERNRWVAQNFGVRTPCQTVILDHLVPRDLFGPVDPRIRVVGELAGRGLYESLRAGRDLLDVYEQVEHLGTGPNVLHTPDIPRYREMIEHACRRLGWDVERLDVYRVRMEYPYVPVTINLDYPLPEG